MPTQPIVPSLRTFSVQCTYTTLLLCKHYTVMCVLCIERFPQAFTWTDVEMYKMPSGIPLPTREDFDIIRGLKSTWPPNLDMIQTEVL